MITSVNEFNKYLENVSKLEDLLVIGRTYKIYDKENNGKLLYSSAVYCEKTSDGYKFAITNRPSESFETITDITHMAFVPTTPYTKK